MTRISAPAPRMRHEMPRHELVLAALSVAFGLSSGPAWANPAPTPPGTTEVAPTRSPVVRVESHSPELTDSAIRAAIQTELERSAGSADLAAATLEVSVNEDRVARVAVHTASGETRSRELQLPADPSSALEVLGLVSASLVRSDADALAEALRARNVAPQPATPSATAVAVDAAAKPSEAPPTTAAPQGRGDASSTPSKAPAKEPVAPSKPSLRSAPVNASLVHPLAVLPDSDERVLNFELGLIYSRVGAIDGFGLSGLVLRTEQDVQGAAIAGLWSHVGGDTTGLNIAGLFSRSQGSLEGLSVSGVVDLRTGSMVGGQFGGVFAANAGTEGIQAGGVFARSGNVLGMQAGGVAALGEDTTGIQAGGVGSVASDLRGLQAGGVFAWAENTEGLQVGGVTALADDITGAQIAGVVSSAHDVHGAQIAGVNVAHRVRGVQIGVVNVADRVDGFPIGLVNAVGNGRNQVVAWYGGEQMPMNLGLKYLHGPIYTLLAVGAKPNKDDKGDVYGAGAGLGAHINLYRDAFLELDGLWMHESRFEQNDNGVQTVRGRAALGYQITDKLGVFAGGGPLFFYEDRPDEEVDETGWEPHFFAGVQVF